jgi:FlaA1/EpsC-like NDP-sugar epimerase
MPDAGLSAKANSGMEHNQVPQLCWLYMCDDIQAAQAQLVIHVKNSPLLTEHNYTTPIQRLIEMMKAIAVAGGSGGVGRAIVDELVRSGEHKIFVLARKVGTHAYMNPNR